MKPLILIVEDNPDILFNIRLILEANDFEVIGAQNGKDAIEILSGLEKPPELIISDIMMPEVDGYDLFKTVSNDIRWGSIPFIFLTARTAPEDIRFAKMLGVDDYLTKPFNEDDLLAIIHGKLKRNKRIKSINDQIKELFSSLEIEMKSSISKKEQSSIFLIIVIWDDRIGPELKFFYPTDKIIEVPASSLGQQLFQSTISIYGNEIITKAEGLLLNIENIKRNGYIFFDSMPDEMTRTGERQFMIGVIAPKINYFKTFEIKEILRSLSSKVKKKEKIDIKYYWEQISKILMTPALESLDLGS